MSNDRCLVWFITCLDPTGEEEVAVWYRHQTGLSPLLDHDQAIEGIKREMGRSGGDPDKYCWEAIPHFGHDEPEDLIRRTRLAIENAPIPYDRKKAAVSGLCQCISKKIEDHRFFEELSANQPGGHWVN